MKETQEKARVARVKEPVKAQVRVLDKRARALVRVARVKEQDKVQAKVQARETKAKVLVKKGISKKRLK